MSLDIYLKVKDKPDDYVFERNITHNLINMADAAGLYIAMWAPNENKLTKAWQLIPLLERGIQKLLAEPDEMKKLNPSNGWGDYDVLLNVAAEYLEACRAYPDADIYAYR